MRLHCLFRVVVLGGAALTSGCGASNTNYTPGGAGSQAAGAGGGTAGTNGAGTTGSGGPGAAAANGGGAGGW